MSPRIATVAGWGLVLLLGIPAYAQNADKGGNNQGNSQKGQDAGQGQAQNQTQTVRGELAAVSVVGETMVDYRTGRGVEADLTYMTILGSPAQGGQGRDGSGQADSRHDDANKGNNNQGDQARARDGGANRRRTVYQIAIGPETRVRHRGGRGGQGSGGNQGNQNQNQNQNQSGTESTQAALEQLELGDRVEVEFTPLNANGSSGSGDQNKAASGTATRHGRHRMVRGVARTVTILAHNQQGDNRRASDVRKDNNSSSGSSGDKSSSGNKSSSGDK